MHLRELPGIAGCCATLALAGCHRDDPDNIDSARPKVAVTRVPSPVHPGQNDPVVTLKEGESYFVQQAAGSQEILVANLKGELFFRATGEGAFDSFLLGSRLRLQGPERAYVTTQRSYPFREEKRHTEDYPYVDVFYDTDGDGLPDYKEITLGRYRLAEVEWEKIGDASAPEPGPDHFPEPKPPLEIYRARRGE